MAQGIENTLVNDDKEQMPATTKDIPRKEIKPKVIHNIAVVSGFDEDQIEEESRLFEDLGMTDDLRAALAPGFEQISKTYNTNASVSKSACNKLSLVSEAIDLVVKAAQ